MTPYLAQQSVIIPTLDLMDPILNSKEAQQYLLTIAQQESRLTFEDQMKFGPARGLWQNEIEFVEDAVTRGAKWLQPVCAHLNLPMIPEEIWGQLDRNDMLACGVARVKLKLSSHPLTMNRAYGWSRIYIPIWDPGIPRPDTWNGYWDAAYAVVFGSTTISG